MVDFEKDKQTEGFMTNNGYPSMMPNRDETDEASATLRRRMKVLDIYLNRSLVVT